MGLGKALGFSLLAYVGLNFLFIIISYTISMELNTLFSDITSNPLIILVIFFGPIIDVPSSEIFTLYAQISLGTFDATLIQTIGFIVTPFVASIVAGRTGGSKGASFGGWMITCLISSSALGVLGFISPITLGFTAAYAVTFLIMASISAAINGVFYGCFALLFTKAEMY
ncbi:MAG: hypothetical protein KGD74_08950 [Candidatus Lokiarchaeota archaeon]|nr:hypothetical protein [Candidatus Lokiarchaeota archaeon]